MEHIRIESEYRNNELNKFETQLIKLLMIAPKFELGKLSIIYPDYYKAVKMIKMSESNSGN